MESLLDMMYHGDISEYNVRAYTEQIRTFWRETKSDFEKLLTWEDGQFPDNEEFHRQTERWNSLFRAIQASYTCDDSCNVMRIGDDPMGKVAASILELRYNYGYYFALPYIETDTWLQKNLKKMVAKLLDMEYIVEYEIPGITQVDGENTTMLTSTTYKELLHELTVAYLDPTTRGYPILCPWSGGKDSTLVAKALFEMLDNLPRYKHIRPVHICYANTGLEPITHEHVQDNAWEMAEYGKVKQLPVEIHQVHPDVSQRFFALLIGAGYPPATSNLFRWCTDRLKIRPIHKKIAELAVKYGGVVTVLGTRENESKARKRSIIKNSTEYRYTPKRNYTVVDGTRQHINQLVYQPIRYFTTGTVWAALEEGGLPWGLGYSRLKKLYKDASGECPLVADSVKDGCSSARFGCFVCAMVKEDKSLANFIKKEGNEWMRPLYEFRRFIIELAGTPDMREPFMYDRKTGRILKENTKGAFTKQARRLLFEELLKLRSVIAHTKPDTDFDVVTDEEINQIKAYWAKIDGLTHWKETQLSLY